MLEITGKVGEVTITHYPNTKEHGEGQIHLGIVRYGSFFISENDEQSTYAFTPAEARQVAEILIKAAESAGQNV